MRFSPQSRRNVRFLHVQAVAALIVKDNQAVKVLTPARSSSAIRSISGNTLPPFSKSPRRLSGLNSIFSGTTANKMRDKKDMLPPLGNSPVSGIQNPPRQRVAFSNDRPSVRPLLNVSSTVQLTEDQSKPLSALRPNGRLARQKTVRGQRRQQVDHEVHKTAMTGMLHLAYVFQETVHRLYHGALAQKQLVPNIYQHVFHVLLQPRYEPDALEGQQLEQLLRYIPAVAEQLSPEIAAKAVVNVAGAEVKRQYLPHFVDHKVELEPVEPPGGVFPVFRHALEHLVAVYAPAMAHFYRRGVDEAYAGHRPRAGSLGVQGQRHQACAHKLHEPVVADKSGEISPHVFYHVIVVIPLEWNRMAMAMISLSAMRLSGNHAPACSLGSSLALTYFSNAAQKSSTSQKIPVIMPSSTGSPLSFSRDCFGIPIIQDLGWGVFYPVELTLIMAECSHACPSWGYLTASLGTSASLGHLSRPLLQ